MRELTIPTIFAKSRVEFEERFRKVVKIAKRIQVDFMDGSFVSTKSVQLSDIPSLKNYRNEFEAHLMVSKPDEWVKFLYSKGFSKVIIHYESYRNEDKIESVIKMIKDNKMKCFIAINPETKLSKIIPYINKIDGILIMGVEPGKEHQEFIEKVYKKIYDLRSFNKNIEIQVDGGVNMETAPLLAQAGASLINSGSFVADALDVKSAFDDLNGIFEGNLRETD